MSNEPNDPKKLFGYRLRQARLMKGWSLRELSAAMPTGVSHNALAKYERAEMMPSSEVLCIIADALSQSADFFFRRLSLKLEPEAIRFRKKSRLSVKVADAIREQATDYFERYFEIEQITADVRAFGGKLHGTVSTPEEAEQAATTLRKQWKLGTDPIPNVVELMEFHGIKVFEAPTTDDGFDGFSCVTKAGPIVVLAAWLSQNLPRKRMTATHELGHIMLTLPKDISEKEEEEIMKRFAGSFLLPEDSFRAAFGKHRQTISQEELIAMKCLFGASIMSIMFRAKQLGMITPSTAEKFFRYASSHGWRSKGKGEPGNDRYQGQEQYSRFRQLVYRAAAEEQISLTKGAALLGLPLGQFRGALRNVFD